MALYNIFTIYVIYTIIIYDSVNFLVLFIYVGK